MNQSKEEIYYTKDELTIPSNPVNEVEIKIINEIKGRGIFSTQNISKDSSIFLDKPLLAIQHSMNRGLAKTCAHCFKFLGSLEEQLYFFYEDLGIKDHQFPFNLNLSQLGDFNCTKQPNVPCSQGCGEFYCSASCRDLAYELHHKVLCVGKLEENHPLVQFKKLAISSNHDIFLLAAQAIACIISEWQRNDQNLQKALAPLVIFHKRPYLEVTKSELKPKELNSIVSESLQLLSQSLFTQELLALSWIFSEEFYSLLLGLLELNDNGIEIPSPLQLLLESLPNFEPTIQSSVFQALQPVVNYFVQLQDNEDEEDNEMESEETHEYINITRNVSLEEALDYCSIFPSFEGIGLFTLNAMLNHSCAPNAEVRFNSGMNQSSLIALHSIQSGEEITISYIDPELTLEERREELRGYGFICNCSKCIEESS